MATDARLALQQRLEAVTASIASAARSAGRSPDDITLIGVTKLFPATVVRQVLTLGLVDLGENRVEELLDKQAALTDLAQQPRWHLIGTLQRRKVRQIIGKTVLIHSVDSVRLAEEIDKRSQAAGLVTDILLQVNSSEEANKHGFLPDDSLTQAAEQLAVCPGIRLRGLMTMAQLTDQPAETRPVFERTRRLFDQVQDRLALPDWQLLSMGMSQDYLQAIACGATHVRIGSAVFGSRTTS